mmetsp:Transcript_26326/g.65187  ORF Transcript_26326/g.65187 Transcript_26326/m.65187 type:complete len:201 (+) Transcript_26326:385-987(+)
MSRTSLPVESTALPGQAPSVCILKMSSTPYRYSLHRWLRPAAGPQPAGPAGMCAFTRSQMGRHSVSSAIHTQFSFLRMFRPRETGASGVYPIASESSRSCSHSTTVSTFARTNAPGTLGTSVFFTGPQPSGSNRTAPPDDVQMGRSARCEPLSRVTRRKWVPSSYRWVGRLRRAATARSTGGGDQSVRRVTREAMAVLRG